MSVYLIKINDKNRYIGSTINISARKSNHKSRCFSDDYFNYPLYEEMRKHTTKETFYSDIIFEILENDISNENLTKREDYYIKNYDMIENGLNIRNSICFLSVKEYYKEYNKVNSKRIRNYYQNYNKVNAKKNAIQKKGYYKNLPIKHKCIFCKYKCKTNWDFKRHTKRRHPNHLLFLFLFSLVVLF